MIQPRRSPATFPYIPPPTLSMGAYSIGAFTLLAIAALFVEYGLVVSRAPRHGVARGDASALVLWAIATGMAGAHVFDVLAYQPQRLAGDPLALFEFWGELSSMGGMLFGLLGLAWAMRRRGMGVDAMLRFADAVLFALPFTLAVGRAGCALQHDHLGVASGHWSVVRFPDGPRFDLGLLEFLCMLVVSVLFAGLSRRTWPAGFYGGLFFALYGPVRFALDTLRTGDARYFGATPAQYLSVLAATAGSALLVRALRAERQANP